MSRYFGEGCFDDPPPPKLSTREFMRNPRRCKNASTWLIWNDLNWDAPEPRAWACEEHYVDVCRKGERVTAIRPIPFRCQYRFKRGEEAPR